MMRWRIYVNIDYEFSPMEQPWYNPEDGTTQRAMVEEAKQIVPKKSELENTSLDAHRNFDYLKAESQYSDEIFPWSRIV